MSDVYLTEWDPREYLQTYYVDQVYDDDRAIFAEAAEWVRGRSRYFERCLEVGCGPTIHHSVPFVPVVGELHLSDYLPSNLAEVQRWRDRADGAHDWSAHIRECLVAEGVEVSPQAVETRADELRQKLTQLKVCDLRRGDPTGDGSRYDLVTSFYTTECVATDLSGWKEVMCNLLRLVRPGGEVFMASILNCQRYDIMGRWFETAAVSASDVSAALVENGFPETDTRIRTVRTQDMAEHGFARIYLVSAIKSAERTKSGGAC